MFHRAVDLKLLDGVKLEVAFQDGVVKQYDMRQLYTKYPSLTALDDRALFVYPLNCRLMASGGMRNWT